MELFETDEDSPNAIDTQSIIFEIKLNELQKLAQDKGVTLNLTYTSVT